MLHALEQRRLLSASLGYDSARGLIEVTGSDNADQIEVTVEYTLVKPTDYTLDRKSTPVSSGALDCTLPQSAFVVGPNRPALIESAEISVFDGGTLTRRVVLPLSVFKNLNISGGRGDDTITVSNNKTPIFVTLVGDEGDDVLESTIATGAPGAEVYGGDGNDTIYLWAARGAVSGQLARGGGGDDLIFGSTLGDSLWGDDDGVLQRQVFGNDTIFAGDGDDRVWGGGGNDVLYGNDGNDWLWGGDGNDVLYGNDGDDWLCGDDGSDMLDGGSGHDTGMIDDFDKYVGLEEVAYAS